MTALAKIPSSFVESDIDDETVVMSLASGSFFSLRGTARVIWDLIDGELDERAIVKAVAVEYQVLAEEISADVRHFIAELLTLGLVQEK